jgi:hypothetical protein
MNVALDLLSILLLSDGKIMATLEVEPELGCGAEIPPQPDRGICSDSPRPFWNFRKATIFGACVPRSEGRFTLRPPRKSGEGAEVRDRSPSG